MKKNKEYNLRIWKLLVTIIMCFILLTGVLAAKVFAADGNGTLRVGDEKTDIISNGECGESVTWMLDEEGTLTISGNGKMSDYDSEGGAPWGSYNKQISKIVFEGNITHIGRYVFSGCKVNTVAFPDNVTSIAEYAFANCFSLESIFIPSKVTSIGENAFYCCNLTSIQVDSNNTVYDSRDNCNAIIETASNKLLFGSAYTIIPSSVTSIGDSAFRGCEKLTSITLPYGVTYIGDYAFAGCTELTSIDIPNSVKTIGSSGFYCCLKLQSITIPDSITRIEESVFAHCGLTSITLPDSVKSIGFYAFYSCTSLKSIAIPNSVTSIDVFAFSDCWNIKSITVDKNNAVYDSRDNCNAIIETSSNTIFLGCRSTVIPSSVTCIGERAFSHCNQLTELTIPISVRSIGNHAFAECRGLKNITIPNRVTSIGDYAFYECNSLTSITIPSSVMSIGNRSFDCTRLNTLYFLGNAPAFDEDVFHNGRSITAYYPDNNSTWTNEVLKDYGGYITWVPWDSPEKNITFIGIKNEKIELACPCQKKVFAIIQNGGSLSSDDVTWTSSNPSAVEIMDSTFFVLNGTAYAEATLKSIDAGTLTITMSLSDGNEAMFEVISSKDVIENVTVSSTKGELALIGGIVGSPIWLQAIITPDDAPNKTVTWSSNNTKIASVDQNGKVIPKTQGTVIITAKCEGKTGSITIIVADKSIMDYSDYEYKFSNWQFSYDWNLLTPYKIPKERYMQIGYSEAQAERMVKEWGGNCYGMTMSSILFYMGLIQEENYTDDESVHFPNQLPRPNTDSFYDKKLRGMIELFQIMQSKIYYSDFSEETVRKVIKQLDEGIPVKMGLDLFEHADDKKPKSGHAVVIYNYTKDGNATTFNIYDCSGFIDHFTYINERDYTFEPYLDDTYIIEPDNFVFYEDFKDRYDFFLTKNYNNACSLLRSAAEPSFISFFTPAVDLDIVNSVDQVITIRNSELSSEIEDASLILSGQLAETPSYMITAPSDSYTVNGTQTFSAVNGNISIDIDSSVPVPISFSADLHEITIDGMAGDYTSITFNTYGNIYDKLIINSNLSGPMTVHLRDDYLSAEISGAQTVDIITTVGDQETNVSAETNGSLATIEYVLDESIKSIHVTANGEDLTDNTVLGEREKTPAPRYDLPEGAYEEGKLLSFEKDEDTLIYYTQDGSEPIRETGLLYTLPIEVNQTMKIRAIAYKYGCTESEELSLDYDLPDVAVPEANYKGGSYDSVLYVDLSCEDQDAQIYYSVNDDPRAEWRPFVSSIVITEDTVLSAYAEKNGCISETVDYYYEVTPKESFLVNNTPVAQDGAPVTEEIMTGLSSVSLNVLNLTGNQKSGHFGIVFYDDNDQVISVVEQNEIIAEEGGEVVFEVNDDVSSAVRMEYFIDEFMVIVNGGFGTGSYAANEQVTVVADSSDDKPFEHWSGSEVLTFLTGDANSRVIVFNMPESSLVLTGNVGHNHSWDTDYTIDKEATCTEKGSKSIHCAVCGSIKEGSTLTIPAKGHAYSDWIVTKEATCTTAGSREKACSICNDKVTETIAAMGHTWMEEYTVDKEATCTEEGSESKHCSVCGVIDETTVRGISAKGHAYGDWVVTKEATYEEDGSREKTCSHCGDKIVEVIPKLSREGWVTISGKRYFYVNGKAKTKWHSEYGKWYYLDPDDGGAMTIGICKAGAASYYMNKDGVMQTGWIKNGDIWYYANTSGTLAAGWLQIGPTWYYMDPNSFEMQVGWVTVGKAKYYMEQSGAMVTGWVKDGENWYFMNSSGAMATGWVKSGTTWYYMDNDGVMQTGWVTIGGSKYYMASSGAMLTGWVKEGDTWYYLNSSGAMVTNWIKVGNTWYFFKSNGAMAASEWVPGYYWISASGAWTYQPVGSWKKNDTGWWFGDTSGWYAKNETLKINDIFYTFNAAGYWVE